MNIRVLGASGSEAPGQNSPAFLVDDFLLFDAGTISPSLDRAAQCKISHVFLTHAHMDHIKGLPFLVDNFITGDPACRVVILSGDDVIADVRSHIFNNRIWPDFSSIPSPENAVLSYQVISTSQPLEVKGYLVCAVRVDHSVPSYGYIIEEAASGHCVVYTGDTGPTERIWKQMNGRKVKALIVETSFPNEMEQLAIATGHLTPALLAGEIKKMPVLPEKIYISHLKAFFKETIQEQLSDIHGMKLEILEDGTILSF